MNDRLNKSASTQDFMEMDLHKIREFIAILEEHQLKCEQSGRFVEAEMAKKKVEQFKKIEEEKLILDKQANHQETKLRIENEFKEELDIFNQEWDINFSELNEKYEGNKQNLLNQNQQEIETFIHDSENKYPKEPKAATELLNLQRILDQVVKQKEYFNLLNYSYTKAHQIQLKIHEFQKVDYEKFNKIKADKLNKESLKLKEKSDLEMTVFQDKFNQTFNELKRDRAFETEK